MLKTRKTIAIFFIFLFTIKIFSLEITDGKIKLIMHEKTGRISLYYLTDLKKSLYKPLLFAEDPRTTIVSILIGNKIYEMGESSSFSQEIQQTQYGGKFIFKSKDLIITQDISFIKSEESPLSDGIKIIFTIENISETALDIGLKYLIDTYLGEEGDTHFYLDNNSQILGETLFSRDEMPNFWVSKYKSEEDFGFLGMLKGKGITRPEKVIFANWKRLNDAAWQYDAQTQRNFNLLPYSINDSALCYFFDQRTLLAKEKREIVMAIGKNSKNGFTLDENQSTKDITALFEKTMEASKTGDKETQVKTDIIAITDLINQINRIIESGADISDEEVDVLEQLIEKLEKRKTEYDLE